MVEADYQRIELPSTYTWKQGLRKNRDAKARAYRELRAVAPMIARIIYRTEHRMIRELEERLFTSGVSDPNCALSELLP